MAAQGLRDQFPENFQTYPPAKVATSLEKFCVAPLVSSSMRQFHFSLPRPSQ